MPKKVPEEAWVRYFKFRNSMTSYEAALRSGINKTTAWRLENVPNHNSSGRKHLEAWRAKSPGSITDKQRLNTQAKRALNDFAYFRLRYFGRKSTPWQVYAANVIREAHEQAKVTMDRKFIVINLPPGSGKSTLATHDLPLWLLCRDRSTRVLIGSATETLARGYTEQMMTTLERQAPPPLEEHQRRRGAVQADACLVEDFGRFKPDNGRNWRTGAFKISQPNDLAATTKEASVSAFGRDSSYLGQRPDVAIWDDLVTEETSGTVEARERTLRKWQREAEQRVEPGGVLVLQGQRLFGDDLYRYCIDLPGDEDDGEEARKYTHIVFKAHYEEHCKGDHGKDAQPYDPADPENSGCLLDPVGLSWKFLKQVQRDDENEGTQTFKVVFQQEDGTSGAQLVDPLWIEGGENKTTGEQFRGCWDHDRIAGVVPPLRGGLSDVLSIVTVDSSPKKFWAVQWWLVDLATDRRFLVDMRRAKMSINDVLRYDKDTGVWSGLFDDWRWTADRQGRRITHLVFEANAAEDFFLDSSDLTDWKSKTPSIQVVKHTTHGNKSDPKYGVQTVGPLYRHGLVRLPGDVGSGSKAKVMPLVREVTRWPDASTEDCHPAGTMILTAEGPKPIELVRAGDQVMTHLGRWRPVEAAGSRRESDAVYRIRAAGALPLSATGNHPILVVPGRREGSTKREVYDYDSAEFIPTSKIVGSARHSENPTALVTPFDTRVLEPSFLEADDTEFALLLGIYLAEGSLAHHSVAFGLNINERYIADWLITQMKHRYGCNHNEVVRDGSLSLHFQSVRAKADFIKFGKREHKALPTEALLWPKPLQRAVLRGWLIGDGSLSNGRFRGTSISRPLLHQMETFASRNGAATRLAPFQAPREGVIKGRQYKSRWQWQLAFGEAALANVLEPGHALDARRWSRTSFKPGRNVGMQVDTERGFVLRKLRHVDAEPFDGVVYNLQVEEDETFVAENLAVHNCLMAQWFLEFKLPALKPCRNDIPAQRRPSWLTSIPDGRGLQLVASR